MIPHSSPTLAIEELARLDEANSAFQRADAIVVVEHHNYQKW